VLAKVAALPITRWNYKTQPDQEHVGPVAQDFAAAFRLGSDDKHIATVDAAGVAFAAIQGLNDLVSRQAAELTRKQNQIDSLQQRLDRLEQLVTHARAAK
jgi:flagellin-like hook-associated protein FlgL